MYVQVVTYGLGGIGENEYLDVANGLAPRFSGIPGLEAKIWLEDPEYGRYGAIYFWADRESMERFLHSDLFEATNRDFVDVESEGFGILENLTAQTQPVLEVIQPRRRPAVGRRPQKAVSKKAPAARPAPTAGVRKVPVTTKPAPTQAASKKRASKAVSAGKASAKKATTKKATTKKAID
jgi:heme-degrading monooxygenase HmoA